MNTSGNIFGNDGGRPAPRGTPAIVTKAAFARLHGWNRSTATKYAKQNRLVLTEDGRVDVEASNAKLAATADPSKIGVSERHEAERQLKAGDAAPAVSPSSSSSPRIDVNDESYLALQKSRAEHEAHRAAIAKMDREEREGKLVDAETVRKAAAKAARAARSALMNLPSRLGPLLAAQNDQAKCIVMLETEIRAICEQLAGDQPYRDVHHA